MLQQSACSWPRYRLGLGGRSAAQPGSLLHRGKLNRWLQPGGHIEDCDPTAQDAARREAQEEAGLSGLHPIGGLFDVDGMDSLRSFRHIGALVFIGVGIEVCSRASHFRL